MRVQKADVGVDNGGKRAEKGQKGGHNAIEDSFRLERISELDIGSRETKGCRKIHVGLDKWNHFGTRTRSGDQLI